MAKYGVNSFAYNYYFAFPALSPLLL